MATAETAVTPEINADVMAQLVNLAGYVAGDFSNGFMFRAEAAREDLLKDPTNPDLFDPARRPGNLFAGCDYAFRELMNPERRVAMAAAFECTNAYRAAHYGEQYCDALPLADVSVAIRVANKVLDAAALEQEDDRLLEAVFDDTGFWGEFIGEIFAFFDSGEVTDRS